MASASRASPIRPSELDECRNLIVWPSSLTATASVLSQTVACTVRLIVVASEPSTDVAASRFGRNSTPSGVVIVSGTLTSTQATAPSRSSPAEEIARSSSKIVAMLFKSHCSYGWIL